MLIGYKQGLTGKQCSKCNASTLAIAEVKDLIEDLVELAEEVGAKVEVISVETEEGQMLKNSFGGIAAILRYKLSN